jgi:peptidoglycan/xylan/chitin deacetylase (PgdA/CDA1 family)
MGLGIQPAIARATYKLNCLSIRVIPQRRQVTVLTYHRIGTRREVYPETSSLAECTTEQFAAHMAWLRRYATPIDVTTFDAIVNDGAPCPNRAVLVTFDDGYRADMFRVRPSLEETGIRPVMFLPTDFIGTRRRFWWDRIGFCVETSVRRRLVVELGHRVDLPLDTSADRDAASALLLGHAKWLAPEAREAWLAALEEAAGIGSSAEASDPIVASWDEVRELSSCFDYGEHTMSHPLLSRTPPEQIRHELAGAKARVEAEVGRPCISFAIPFGNATDYTPEVLPIAAEVGIRLVFSLEDTLRPPHRVPGSALVDRVTLNAASAVEGMAAKVTWPQVFVPDWSGKVQAQLARWLRPS